MHQQSTGRDPSPVSAGWSAFFQAIAATEPPVTRGTVALSDLVAARHAIRAAMWDLGRLSRSINAYASDDAFEQPNAADLAIEELTLALEHLEGEA